MIFESKEPQVVKVGDIVEIKPIIRCEQCEFHKEDTLERHLDGRNGCCTRAFASFGVMPYDGCTFGRKVTTNEEKFEEIFGISFYTFIVKVKHEDQLQWGKNKYQEEKDG